MFKIDRQDTSTVCAVGSEKLDIVQPINSSMKDRIRLKKSITGTLGFGSGDCAREENIVSLSRTQSACSNRSTIEVKDRPPEIENESSEEFRQPTTRLVIPFYCSDQNSYVPHFLYPKLY